jgi:4a-hydroxytetrahydrobiopterin dehydratase
MERGPEDQFADAAISEALSKLDGWEYAAEHKALRKTYVRANFLDAVAFIQKAAAVAEEQDHHPDILLHKYKNLTFTLSTHSAGGVTQNDIDLANALDALDQAA